MNGKKILAFIAVCILFTTSVGYGEGDTIPTYEVFPQTFNDASYIMEHGMGGVELEMVPAENGSVQGYVDGYSLELNSQTGFFFCPVCIGKGFSGYPMEVILRIVQIASADPIAVFAATTLD